IALVPFSNTVRIPLVTNAKRSNNKLSMLTYTGANQVALGVPSWIDPKAEARWPGGNNYDIVDSKLKADRFALLKNISQDWYGCLESRGPDNDVSGLAPGTTTTNYVPYFWPDEPDGTNTAYLNNYLN